MMDLLPINQNRQSLKVESPVKHSLQGCVLSARATIDCDRSRIESPRLCFLRMSSIDSDDCSTMPVPLQNQSKHVSLILIRSIFSKLHLVALPTELLPIIPKNRGTDICLIGATRVLAVTKLTCTFPSASITRMYITAA